MANISACDGHGQPALGVREDYCKAIFSLESRAQPPVLTNALAERLGITAGSVSAMLRKLEEL